MAYMTRLRVLPGDLAPCQCLEDWRCTCLWGMNVYACLTSRASADWGNYSPAAGPITPVDRPAPSWRYRSQIHIVPSCRSEYQLQAIYIMHMVNTCHIHSQGKPDSCIAFRHRNASSCPCTWKWVPIATYCWSISSWSIDPLSGTHT